MERFSAYSPETAKEMAEGVRLRAQTHFGLAVTGIAGPGEAQLTSRWAWHTLLLAAEENTIVQRYFWKGTREQIKERVAGAALHLLWKTISEPQSD